MSFLFYAGVSAIILAFKLIKDERDILLSQYLDPNPEQEYIKESFQRSSTTQPLSPQTFSPLPSPLFFVLPSRHQPQHTQETPLHRASDSIPIRHHCDQCDNKLKCEDSDLHRDSKETSS